MNSILFFSSEFTKSEWLAFGMMGLLVIGSYFVGNISPAILLGKLSGVDITKSGSGNAGTTNALRVLGKKAAVITLCIDIFKGVLAVSAGRYLGLYFLSPKYATLLPMICGLAVFIGHIWPVVFGFHGGKGIATGFGVIVTVVPRIGICVMVIALLGILLSRRVSVGSVAAAVALPILAYFMGRTYFLWALIMATIAIFKHRENIKRIFLGQEQKLSFKK